MMHFLIGTICHWCSESNGDERQGCNWEGKWYQNTPAGCVESFSFPAHIYNIYTGLEWIMFTIITTVWKIFAIKHWKLYWHLIWSLRAPCKDLKKKKKKAPTLKKTVFFLPLIWMEPRTFPPCCIFSWIQWYFHYDDVYRICNLDDMMINWCSPCCWLFRDKEDYSFNFDVCLNVMAWLCFPLWFANTHTHSHAHIMLCSGCDKCMIHCRTPGFTG